MTGTKAAGLSFSLRRTIPGSVRSVFRAWTEPKELKRWWVPPGYSLRSARSDLREGGRYRFLLRSPGGEDVRISGVYREVSRPRRLVYTWMLKGTAVDARGVVITVDFSRRGKSTMVRMAQAGFTDLESRRAHREEWKGSLEKLKDLRRPGGA